MTQAISSATGRNDRRRFDVVVIGTGSAGATVATTCRRAGRSVAVIDSRPFGGTCANRGCDPKRVLIGAAELVDWGERFGDRGIVTGSLRVAWPELMRFKRSFTEPVPRNSELQFRELGIETFHERAAFVDHRTLRAGSALLEADVVAIAAGARRRTLKFHGEELLTSSTAFLELDELPPHIAFVGGGYISFEFAHLAARAGARVEILHGGSRPLKGFDPDLVDRLVEMTRAIGVRVELDAPVQAIERIDSGFRVRFGHDEDVRFTEADMVVHGAGRVPEIDDMGLDLAGIAYTAKGVAVNAYLQSQTNPAVYAAGDAADAGGVPLTPVAGLEGEVVATNILEGNRRTVDFTGLATIVYTIPPLGLTGLSEDDARARGHRFTVHAEETTDWFSSARILARGSAYKVLVEDETDKILGASVLGPHAEELTNVLALAIRAGVSATQFREFLFAYPTASSDLEYMV